MKIGFNLRRLPAFLLLLCAMTSYGQVLLTDAYYPPTALDSASHQDHPAQRRLSKRSRLSVINHEGEVVLTTGVRLWGHLSYQPITNTLRVGQDNAWHTYEADQLRYFSYTDQTDKRVHVVTAFAVRLATGETRTLLLEELIPGAPIPLLQLPLPNGQREAIMLGLPQPRTANWQTETPCYVWFDGRLLAPDVFVRTEIDALLTIVPESVQYWAAAYPRPTSLPQLARWLSYFGKELSLARSKPGHVQPKPTTKPASTSVPGIDAFL